MSETLDSGADAATSGPTDAQHDWVQQICGIDPRCSNSASSNSASSDSASSDSAPSDSASSASVSSASPAAAPPAATDEVEGASGALGHLLTDAASVATGALVHAVAGAVPLGFVGAAAIDTEVAAKATPEEKHWYGMGAMAAGVFDMAQGAVEIVGGVLAAPETGGISLAVTAEGVNEIAGGLEAVTAGSTLMSQGSPGSAGGSGGGGKPTPGPRKADALREKYRDALRKTDNGDYNEMVDDADAKLKALDKAQDEYEATDTTDPAIAQKHAALQDAEAASEESLQSLNSESSTRNVLPGGSRYSNGRIIYNAGQGVKTISAWTEQGGPLRAIQDKAGLEDLPKLGNRTNVRGGWWNGAGEHYQVLSKAGGILDYDVIRSTIDGQELWSWINAPH